MSRTTRMIEHVRSQPVRVSPGSTSCDRAAAMRCPCADGLPSVQAAEPPLPDTALQITHSRINVTATRDGDGDPFWGQYIEQRLQHFSWPG